jgi:hypothetical protein
MSHLEENLKPSKEEDSLQKLARSSGFTETQLLYAFHISQAMEYLLDSK